MLDNKINVNCNANDNFNNQKNIVIVYKNAYLIRLKHKNKMKKY